jgi:hypothetical protein
MPSRLKTGTESTCATGLGVGEIIYTIAIISTQIETKEKMIARVLAALSPNSLVVTGVKTLSNVSLAANIFLIKKIKKKIKNLFLNDVFNFLFLFF